MLDIVVLAGCMALVLAPELPPLRALRLMTFDAFQRVAPRRPTSAPAVIVAIDEESLAAHGQWPWPRTTLARLLKRIADGSPAAVGVDIVMPEPDRLSPGRLPALVPGITPDLAARLARLPSNDVLLGDVLRTLPSVVAILGLETAEPTTMPLIRRAPILTRGGDPGPFVRRFATALRSVDEIDGSAAGHALVTATESGVVRRVPLAAMIGDTLLPTLAVEMLRVATGQPAATLTVGAQGVESVAVGHVVIPTDSDGSVWVHYGPHDPARFVSAAGVLSGRADPAQFGRKLVLVGVTATGLSDYHATPVGEGMPGIEIHAQVLENIFDDDFLTRPRWAKRMEAAVLAVGGLLLILVVPALLPMRAAVVVAPTVLAAVVGLSFVLFLKFRLLIDVVAPSRGLAMSFGVLLVRHYLVEERARRRIQNAFSHYLAPTIVNRLAADPSALKLGGERREVTVMFADLSGFTALSGQVEPEVLTRLVNQYLGYIVEQVEATGGYVDKFIGDAVLAIWGAPAPDPKHAGSGIRTAFASVARIREEHDAAAARGERGFSVKIGLNSGPAVVGNVGTEKRYNYTAVGETVNVASRLESVPPLYGCQVVIGPRTAELACEEFLLRELDRIWVKGGRTAIAVFEPLVERAKATPDQVDRAKRFADALLDYRAMRFVDAYVIWEALAREEHEASPAHNGKGEPPHGPPVKMAERAREFASHPPPDLWDGVWMLTSK